GVGWIVSRKANALLGGLFHAFNYGFKQLTNAYTKAVGMILRVSVIVLLLYAGLLALTYFGFNRTAKGFIPSQDMGYLLVSVQLPDSASKERADRVMHQLEDIALSTKGIRHATTISGSSFALNAYGSNFGSMFVNLKDFGDRREPALHAEAIANQLRA